MIHLSRSAAVLLRLLADLYKSHGYPAVPGSGSSSATATTNQPFRSYLSSKLIGSINVTSASDTEKRKDQNTENLLEMSPQFTRKFTLQIEEHLGQVWQWLAQMLDILEMELANQSIAQRASLPSANQPHQLQQQHQQSNAAGQSAASLPHTYTTTTVGALAHQNRENANRWLLHVMRAGSGELGDESQLENPLIRHVNLEEIQLEHFAHLADGLMYLMLQIEAGNNSSSSNTCKIPTSNSNSTSITRKNYQMVFSSPAERRKLQLVQFFRRADLPLGPLNMTQAIRDEFSCITNTHTNTTKTGCDNLIGPQSRSQLESLIPMAVRPDLLYYQSSSNYANSYASSSSGGGSSGSSKSHQRNKSSSQNQTVRLANQQQQQGGGLLQLHTAGRGGGSELRNYSADYTESIWRELDRNDVCELSCACEKSECAALHNSMFSVPKRRHPESRRRRLHIDDDVNAEEWEELEKREKCCEELELLDVDPILIGCHFPHSYLPNLLSARHSAALVSLRDPLAALTAIRTRWNLLLPYLANRYAAPPAHHSAHTHLSSNQRAGHGSHVASSSTQSSLLAYQASDWPVMQQLTSFATKEMRFRKEIERLRNSARHDIYISVARSRAELMYKPALVLSQEAAESSSLVAVAFAALPSSAATASSIASSSLQHSQHTQQQPISLLCHRLKVKFEEEPGEGSGVTRSFYTAFAEAVSNEAALPRFDQFCERVRRLSHHQQQHQQHHHRGVASSSSNSSYFESINDIIIDSMLSSRRAPSLRSSLSSLSDSIGSRAARFGSSSSRLEVQTAPPTRKNSEDLESEQRDGGAASGRKQQQHSEEAQQQQLNEGAEEEAEEPSLFWQPGVAGFLTPRAVPASGRTSGEKQLEAGAANEKSGAARHEARMLLYRTVGRVIGLAVLSGETIPLVFGRHVLKFLLDQPLQWHDAAFFDPTLFISLQQIIKCACNGEDLSQFDLDFHHDVSSASGEAAPRDGEEQLEGGGGGVTAENVLEWVEEYVRRCMLETCREPLEQMKRGVFELLPRAALRGFTPEQLRLLMNGGDGGGARVTHINLDMLQSCTTFLDETGFISTSSSASVSTSTSTSAAGGGGGAAVTTGVNESVRLTRKLKKWFWEVVRKFNPEQLRNLLYFWTSSPSVPASMQGYQPAPTITIRPPDQDHLPTANTCISRLYVPAYHSKALLRHKLLQAISTRTFGFV